jgi:hypothetical protein
MAIGRNQHVSAENQPRRHAKAHLGAGHGVEPRGTHVIRAIRGKDNVIAEPGRIEAERLDIFHHPPKHRRIGIAIEAGDDDADAHGPLPWR